MPKIRTTNEPGVERDVSDEEALDLQRLGLVLETRATTPEGARRAAERQTKKES